MNTMRITLPFRTVSAANAREHWSTRARRSKQERTVTKMAVRHAIANVPRMVTVVLTRLGPRKLDSDNLAGSFKAIRDGVADALGIDDGSELIQWEYRQEKSKECSVVIEIN